MAAARVGDGEALVTARLYCQQIVLCATGLLPSITAGAAHLFAIPDDVW